MTEGVGDHAGVSRRSLFGGTVAGLLGTTVIDGLIARRAHAANGTRLPRAGRGDGGYGRLRPVTRRDPVTGYEDTLLLPEGFDFSLFGLAGTDLRDGSVTPLGHDGMAAFAGSSGTVRLVRNHEERTGSMAAVPSGPDPGRRYDRKGSGGTSTLQLRVGADGTPILESAWMSLGGTIVNCAGGPTPWGSWLTCEETNAGSALFGWEQEHGYIFEVPAGSDELVDPLPLKAMGRFVHEAVAVDPSTGYVYETEDRRTSGFYRFVPNRPGELAAGGRLEMLAVKSSPQFDTRTGQRHGQALATEWVDIDDPDPVDAEEDTGNTEVRRWLAVYKQGLAKGGATFARLEGCWWGNGAVYLVSTNGGDAGEGQIWEFRPAGQSEGTLRLLYESPDREVLSFPDNITVTPRGALLLCEDTKRDNPALQGITRDGRIFPFCIHEAGDEWCGATFSPDGQYLFVNLQGSFRGDPNDPSTYEVPGRTFAIWGPWQDGVF